MCQVHHFSWLSLTDMSTLLVSLPQTPPWHRTEWLPSWMRSRTWRRWGDTLVSQIIWWTTSVRGRRNMQWATTTFRLIQTPHGRTSQSHFTMLKNTVQWRRSNSTCQKVCGDCVHSTCVECVECVLWSVAVNDNIWYLDCPFTWVSREPTLANWPIKIQELYTVYDVGCVTGYLTVVKSVKLVF